MCLSLAGVHQPPLWRESTGGAVMSAWTNCPPINREAGQLRWLDPHLTSLSWEIHWGKGTKAFQYHAISICKGHQMCNGKRAIGVTRRHKELEWSLFPDARSLLPVISISALMNCWCGKVSWRKCYQQQRGFTACVTRQVVNQWQVNSDLVKCRLCAFYSVTLHDNATTGAWELSAMLFHMLTSSNGIIFRVTGPLCEEFTGPRWIPRTKASDAELWCYLWYAPE